MISVHKFYVLPTEDIHVTAADLKKNVIFYVNNVNWLISLAQKESVCCAVRTECSSSLLSPLQDFS